MCENICKFRSYEIVDTSFSRMYVASLSIQIYSFKGELNNLDDATIISNLKERFRSHMIYVSFSFFNIFINLC